MTDLEYQSAEWWQQRAKEVGTEQAWKEAQELRAKEGAAAEVGINEYLKMQSFSRPERQEEREIESLKISRKTLKISRKTLVAVREGNGIQGWILVALMLTILVTIATCTAS